MSHEYAILYFEINLFSLVLIAIIYHKTRGLSKMVAQRNFAMSIISEMVFFASDTLFVLINEGVVPRNSALMIACKEIYFMSTAMMCFFWFLYFEYLQETALVKKKSTVYMSSSVIWLMVVLLVANLYGKFLFYVDNEGIYHRGPLFILTYILSYCYIVFAFGRVLFNIIKDNGNNRFLILLAFFPVAPGLSGILQFIYPRLPAACVTMSITTLILYLAWIDQLISLDPLTGLNNRKQLVHTYESWAKNHGENERICLYLIDANHFKQINDTFGHLQGDKALVIISEALKSACKRHSKNIVISRYGGDEFVILVILDEEDSDPELKDKINNRLAEICKRENVPFELTVSIGFAYADRNETLKELIEDADEAMYAEKMIER